MLGNHTPITFFDYEVYNQLTCLQYFLGTLFDCFCVDFWLYDSLQVTNDLDIDLGEYALYRNFMLDRLKMHINLPSTAKSGFAVLPDNSYIVANGWSRYGEEWRTQDILRHPWVDIEVFAHLVNAWLVV